MGSRVISSTLKTLGVISNYFKYLKIMNNISFSDVDYLINCTSRVLSILGESKFTESQFITVIGVKNFQQIYISTMHANNIILLL